MPPRNFSAKAGSLRGDIAAPSALLCLAVLASREGLIDSGHWILSRSGLDLSNYYVPLRRFAFEQVRGGHLPLWNPLIFSGTPLLGNFQSALLYPPNWLHILLPENLALNTVIVLHVFLAGLFSYLWGRGRGLSPAASYLAGLTFMFSGQYYYHIYAGQLSNLCAMPWAALVFLALDRWSQTLEPRWCLLGMPAVCLQVLAGHPQYVYYTALAAALYATLSAVGHREPGRLILGLLAMYLGGACLSAAQLLAGLAAVSESSRGGDYWFSSLFSWPPANFITAVMPGFFGDDRRLPYYGRLHPWETSLYVGVVAALLAAHAAWSSPKPSRWRPPAMIAVLTLLALGSHTPLHRALYRFLPGFGMFRGTSKFMFLVTLFLAILAGTGFDRIRDEARWPRLLAFSTLAGGAAMLSLGAWLTNESGGARATLLRWAYRHFPSDDYITPAFVELAGWHAAEQFFICACMIVLFSIAVFLVRYRKIWAYGLPLLASLEMYAFARNTRVAMPPDSPDPPAAWKEILRRREGDDRIYAEWTKFQNRSMLMDVPDVWGDDSFILRRYAEFMAFTQGKNPDRANQYVLFHRFPKILRMLRCRYVLGRTAEEPFLAFDDPLPSALLVPRWELKTRRDDILRSLLDPRFDPRKTVLLETPPVPAPQDSGAASGSVVARRLSTDQMEITAVAARPSILLVTDSYSSGWRAVAYPDSTQRRYSLLPADYVLRAVPLSAGRHHLLLEYSPPEFRIGAIVSIVSLLLYMAAWNYHARR